MKNKFKKFHSRIDNFIHGFSLYRKLIITLLCVFLLLLFVFLISLNLMLLKYDHTLYETNAALLRNVVSRIETEFKDLEDLSFSFLSDSEVQESLIKLKYEDNQYEISKLRKRLYSALTSYVIKNNYVESIHLYLNEQDNFSLGNNHDYRNYISENLIKRTQSARGQVIWDKAGKNPDYYLLGRQILQIKYLTLDELAQVYVVFNINNLIQDTLKETGFDESGADFLLLNDQEILYPPDFRNSRFTVSLNNNFEIQTLHDEKIFISQAYSSEYGFRCIYLQNYNQIFKDIQRARHLCIVAVFIFSVLLLIVLRRQIKKVFRHLDYLLMKIKHFGKTEEDLPVIYDYSQRQDEIGLIHQHFDEMTESVRRLKNENYEKEILLKDTKIRMLQQQINPHFLYNTLDTINWRAQQYGIDEIATMSRALAHLFRTAVSGPGELISLKQELAILDSYLAIQKIRFGDRFEFIATIDPDLENLLVPKLCIQPLVENALKYTLDYTMEDCSIYLDIKDKGDHFVIIVSNTGSQFEDDILQKLRDKSFEANGSGIGLMNIDDRLRLLFGEDYGLEIYNYEERATIKLKIPKDRSGEKADG